MKFHNNCMLCKKYSAMRPCQICTGWVDNRGIANILAKPSHMYNPTITIKGCSPYSDAQAFLDERETRLNLMKCAEFAERNDIEFSEFVARCLNHEFLHHLFDVEHNYDTSHALDNIAKRLKDFWLW